MDHQREESSIIREAKHCPSEGPSRSVPEVLGLYRKRPLRGSVNHIGVGGRFRYSDLKEAAGYGI